MPVSNMYFYRALWGPLALTLLSAAVAQTCSKSQLATLRATLDNTTGALRAGANTARARGIDTTYENITLAVSDLFAKTIVVADAYNASANGIAAAYTSWLVDAEKRSPSYVVDAIAALPCNETQGAIDAVASAAAALAVALANASTRRPTPTFSLLTTQASFSPSDGLLHAATGDAVVYASSYC